MGGAVFGFGTPAIHPSQSMLMGTPWSTTGPFASQSPQQLLQALQQALQLEYAQQQQIQQLVHLLPQKIQQLQYLIQLVAQQQPYQTHQGAFPFSSFGGGPANWLTGTQGVQPQVFTGQGGYVM
jgi:hypothetical protein